MQKSLIAIVLATTVAFTKPSVAGNLSFTAKMKSYRGNEAYTVAYVVGPDEKYVMTLYAAGDRSKYQKDLKRWYRMMKRSKRGIDGTTGASVGSGSSFESNLNLPDKLFNAGYTLRIESAVEDQNYFPDDISISLNDENNGKSVSGTGFIKSLIINF